MPAIGIDPLFVGDYAMTADHFQETITTLMERVPFEMFTIELNTGEKVQIDHAGAISARAGRAVFIAPGGKLHIFDHESVNQVLFNSANTDALISFGSLIRHNLAFDFNTRPAKFWRIRLPIDIQATVFAALKRT